MSSLSHDSALSRSSSVSESGDLVFEVKKSLGSGTYGQVFTAMLLEGKRAGDLIAVKKMAPSDQDGRRLEDIAAEIDLLRKLDHENITKLVGVKFSEEEGCIYIGMELCNGGSLFDYMKGFSRNEHIIANYTLQMCRGLAYLHENHVIHRDLKGSNVLVANKPEGTVIKLADFGCSKAFEGSVKEAKTLAGTVGYMAPEVFHQQYSYAADIWSLGCTVLELLTGEVPFGNKFTNVMQVAWFVTYQNGKPDIPEELSAEAKDFILSCLQAKPEDRPTAAQLLQHPFVRREGSSALSVAREASDLVPPPAPRPSLSQPSNHPEGGSSDTSALSKDTASGSSFAYMSVSSDPDSTVYSSGGSSQERPTLHRVGSSSSETNETSESLLKQFEEIFSKGSLLWTELRQHLMDILRAPEFAVEKIKPLFVNTPNTEECTWKNFTSYFSQPFGPLMMEEDLPGVGGYYYESGENLYESSLSGTPDSVNAHIFGGSPAIGGPSMYESEVSEMSPSQALTEDAARSFTGKMGTVLKAWSTMEEPWFHGKISRDMSTRLLADAPEGTFLFRFSSHFPGTITLSVASKVAAGGVGNWLVKNIRGMYNSGQHQEMVGEYKSLHALVEDMKYKPMRSVKGQIFCPLLRACPKPSS